MLFCPAVEVKGPGIHEILLEACPSTTLRSAQDEE
jgi:hypothetical protein